MQLPTNWTKEGLMGTRFELSVLTDDKKKTNIIPPYNNVTLGVADWSIHDLALS